MENLGQIWRILGILILLLVNLAFVTSDTLSSKGIASEIELSNGIDVNIQKEEKSEEEKDCYENGCFEDNRCYPYGYVKEGKYCTDKDPYYFEKWGVEISAFVNQSDESSSCVQDYECKTGLCYNGSCYDLKFLNEEVNSLKEKVNELSQEITENNSQEKEENATNIITSEAINEDIRDKEGSHSILNKILNWFSRLFN